MKRKIVWVSGPVLLACLLFALHWRWAAVCCGAALNCYHSLWSVAYDSGENAFYLTVMSRKEMAKVLEGIFA